MRRDVRRSGQNGAGSRFGSSKSVCSMAGAGVSLTPAALSAMRYICCAPAKKLFAFPVEGEDLNALYAAAESYILLKSERRFGALDYWKKVR